MILCLMILCLMTCGIAWPRCSLLARSGSKHHLITDRYGTLLAVSVTSGNRHDVTQLLLLLDTIPRIRDLVGRLATGHGSCSPTVATTTTSTDACSAPVASRRGSPARVPPTDPAWA